MIDTILSAAVEVATDDRQFAVDRPSRGVHSTAMRRAATVPGRWRAFHDCVAQRESGGSPSARNPRSSAQGTYQFLDRSWRHGLSFMVRDRLVRVGVPKPVARDVRRWLGSREIATWPALYQTVGFVEVVERGGSYHWRLAGSKCEAYR